MANIIEAEINTVSNDIGRASDMLEDINALARGLETAANTATASLRAGYQFMEEAVERAWLQELAETQMATAISHAAQALHDQASALKQVLGSGEEAIISAQATIDALMQDDSKIQAATRATIELAKAIGIDLSAAADLVPNTLGSIRDALTQYGVQVEKAVGFTERLERITGTVAEIFGGDATALSGQIERVNNAFSDLLEGAVFAFTNNEDFQRGIKTIIGGIDDMQSAMDNVQTVAGEITGPVSDFLSLFTDTGNEDFDRGIKAIIDSLSDVQPAMDAAQTIVSNITGPVRDFLSLFTGEGQMDAGAGNVTEQSRMEADYEAEEQRRLDAITQEQMARKAGETEFNREQEEQKLVDEQGINASRLSMAQSFFAKMEAVSVLFGKKGVNLAKAVAIPMAIIDAYAAFNAALKNPPGPPWTIPIAAAALAAGLARVAAIKNQRYGGGESSGGGAGGDTGGGVSAGGGAGVPAGQALSYEKEFYGTGWRPGEGQQKYQPQLVINFHGDIYDGEKFEERVARAAVNSLRDPNSPFSRKVRNA